MMDNLKGKVVESTSITDSECELTIKFTDGTTLEIRLESWDFDRYKLEIDIN